MTRKTVSVSDRDSDALYREIEENRRRYKKIIQENLLMNKNLKYSPENERYWLGRRTARLDLSSCCRPPIKEYSDMIASRGFVANRNSFPGKWGAPYDYTKYLPPIERKSRASEEGRDRKQSMKKQGSMKQKKTVDES